VLFGSYLRVLCIFALWPLYLYIFTNRTRHRGANRGSGVLGGLGVLRRTTRFTLSSAHISHWHHMLDLLLLILTVEWNYMTPVIYLPLDHLLRHYMDRRIRVWMGMWYSLGVSGYTHTHEELVLRDYNWASELIWSLDQGLGVYVGHTAHPIIISSKLSVMNEITSQNQFE